MTNDKAQPCLKRIDADCFRAHPAWAKQAFAYRLVHLLTPKPLTKRLPKGLRRALLAPGVMLPPGVEMPAGTVVSPGAEIPPGWQPGDLTPPGITIPPGTVFPPGWTPGDPLPEGVTLDPGATFPPGWTPGDPLPPGAIAPGTAPPGVDDTGPTPPTYVAPWDPGPIKAPTPYPPPLDEYWFSDQFSNLTAGAWTNISETNGSATTPAGQLKLVAVPTIGDAGIQRTESRPWPADWTWTFSFKYAAGTGQMKHEIYTGTYLVSITFLPPVTLILSYKWGTLYKTVDNYMNLDHAWKLIVTGQTADIYRDDDPILSNHYFLPSSSFPGRTTLYHDEDGISYTDYMILEDNTA